MINTKIFESCKPDVRIVNVARGGIIDEKDLLQAINCGKCSGAGIDAFVTEPPKGNVCSFVTFVINNGIK